MHVHRSSELTEHKEPNSSGKLYVCMCMLISESVVLYLTDDTWIFCLDVMMTLPPCSITYQHFAELTNEQIVNYEVLNFPYIVHVEVMHVPAPLSLSLSLSN